MKTFWSIVLAVSVGVIILSLCGGCRVLGITTSPGPGITSSPPPSGPASLWWAYVFAALAIVGGIALGYFLQRVILGVCFVAGGVLLLVTLFTLQSYPWVGLVLIGYGVCVGTYVGWDWYRGQRASLALKAIVPSIEAMGATAEPLKDAIAARAGRLLSTVKAEVSAVKNS